MTIAQQIHTSATHAKGIDPNCPACVNPHRRGTERHRAHREAVAYGDNALSAIRTGDSERAGALAMFATRWAKRSLGWER